MGSVWLCVCVVLMCMCVSFVHGDVPLKVCANTITKNLSAILHSTNSVNPALDHIDRKLIEYHKDPTGYSVDSMGFLHGASLHKVVLAPDSPYGIAQEKNTKYLLLLDVDRLVYSFRNNSGLPLVQTPYGGWESPDKELRGHFVGHYLSATSMTWASTHNPEIYKRMNAVVDALYECQEKIGTGYLSAFPESYFDRYEAIHIVWAPYYTIHKIMAGLLDQYMYAGNKKALKMVTWMADYFSKRVYKYVKKYTIEAHFQTLNQEVGGMNDIMYQLYRITGNPSHLRTAHLFDKPCFLGLLAIKEDSLSGFHANTHIPLVVGSQTRYEVTGDEIYKDLSMFFMSAVNSSHLYATGGTSVKEFWIDPKRLATSLDKDTEETCTTYNMLKVARNLFRWTKDIKYMEYYEKALTNGILPIQRGKDIGVTLYMLPLAPGSSKNSSTLHWGTNFDSFWCCYGTAVESFAKLGDSIYFENADDLYVTQFVSSKFTWDSTGLILQQTVKNPLSVDNPNLKLEIKLIKDGHMRQTNRLVSLHIRIPSWTSSSCKAEFNGEDKFITPGTFLSIKRVFEPNDTLTFAFPAVLRLEQIQDDRPEYSNMNAILFGPYLLAGLSFGDYKMGTVNTSSLSDWIFPVSQMHSHLYTFSQVSPESMKVNESAVNLVLGHLNGSLVMREYTRTGQHWNFQSTFKSSVPLNFNGDNGNLTTSLELMDEPGKFIAHNGVDKEVGIVKSLPSSAMFKVTPGLTKESGTVSLESVNFPKCFLTRSGKVVLLRRLTELTEYELASFKLHKGAANYHPISFVANAPRRSYLLFPLGNYVDEHYTVYFDMK